jgi:hypothetical protein
LEMSAGADGARNKFKRPNVTRAELKAIRDREDTEMVEDNVFFTRQVERASVDMERAARRMRYYSGHKKYLNTLGVHEGDEQFSDFWYNFDCCAGRDARMSERFDSALRALRHFEQGEPSSDEAEWSLDETEYDSHYESDVEQDEPKEDEGGPSGVRQQAISAEHQRQYDEPEDYGGGDDHGGGGTDDDEDDDDDDRAGGKRESISGHKSKNAISGKRPISRRPALPLQREDDSDGEDDSDDSDGEDDSDSDEGFGGGSGRSAAVATRGRSERRGAAGAAAAGSRKSKEPKNDPGNERSVCPGCGAAMSRMRDLRRHECPKYSNEAMKKRSVCEWCGKSFGREIDLTRHQIINCKQNPERS